MSWTVDEQTPRGTRELADDTGVMITMHLAESPFDLDEAQRRFGMRDIPIANHIGLLASFFHEGWRMNQGINHEQRQQQFEDRISGILIGAACGDALGAGYEFGPALDPRTPIYAWSGCFRPGGVD